MNIRALYVGFVFALLIGISQLSAAQEITVAAAADLQFAFQDVAARFEKDTGYQPNGRW